MSCPSGTVLLQLKIQGESGCSHSYLAGQVHLDFNGTVETVKIGDMEKNVYRVFRSRQITLKSSGYLVSLGGLPTRELFVMNSTPRDGKQEEKVGLELTFSLYRKEPLQVYQELEI